MFKIVASRSYKFPVQVGLRDEGGNVQQHQFHVLFKRLGASDIDALMQRINSAEKLTDKAICRELILGFGPDVLDADGQPCDFTPENLNALLSIHPVPQSIVRAFFESLNTEQKEVAAAKN